MPQFDEDQLTKLSLDAYAFAQVAELIEERRASLGAEPTSTAHVSLKTAMMVNAGLSLELSLKLIHFRLPTYASVKKLWSHELTKLFDLLDEAVQAELETAYHDTLGHWFSPEKTMASAYIASASPTPPQPPTVEEMKTLRNVFKYMDKATLFLRRYSFEGYSRTSWWVEFDVGFLMMVYGVLSGYAALQSERVA